jgi:plasmid replication initiation protein
MNVKNQVKIMRKFLSSFLRKLLIKIDKEAPVSLQASENVETKEKAEEIIKPKEPKLKKPKGPKLPELSPQERAARDLTEMMEVPFLALSKNRREPIIYEKNDGKNMMRVKVSRHTGHFLASIYDWDIVLFVAGKMQEILNKSSDIPPRTMIIPRHEMLKSLKKHEGKKQQKDLEASLSRLQLTGIDTTIRNEDGRYRAGFGFLDSWGYTKREDIKEIHITLSQWLYDGICAKGSLLMVDTDYFNITSGLKRFLYRTARKHAGGHANTWEFSVETLYEKSGSEREFKKFKSDLKAAVLQNDIPGYHLEWTDKSKKAFVSFKNLKKLIQSLSANEQFNEENLLPKN